MKAVWRGLGMGVWLGLALGARAQEATPTLRISTRLVLLDTNVVDAEGRPVTGLTAKDFAVYEDKQQERIVSFEAPEGHVLPPGEGAGTMFDPGRPATFGSSPVTMFVLDEVNTHFADSAYAVDSIKRYLAKQGDVLSEPATLLAVKDSRFQLMAPFTLDKRKLLAALDQHIPEQAWALEQSMSAGEGVGDRLDRSLAALEQLAQWSARIPGRKNLVWVGAGFPTVDPQALTYETHRALGNMLQHVTDVLLENRVTLYAIDPTTTAAGMTEITDAVQAQVAAAGGSSIRLTSALDPFDRSYDFERLGPVTGGRSVKGLNRVDSTIGASVAAGASYYTLGYRPTSTSEVAGQFRKIRVVCLRPGLTATTHDGYYTSSPKATLASDTVGYDLNNAATSALPLHAVSFTADRDGAGGYVVHVVARDLSWTGAGEGQEAHVQVLAVARNAKGKILRHVLESETATAAAGVDTRAVGQRVRLTAGAVKVGEGEVLRIVVRDTASGRMGTLDVGTEP